MHINNTHICLNKHMKWKGDNCYNEQYNDRSNILQQVKSWYIYILGVKRLPLPLPWYGPYLVIAHICNINIKCLSATNRLWYFSTVDIFFSNFKVRALAKGLQLKI